MSKYFNEYEFYRIWIECIYPHRFRRYIFCSEIPNETIGCHIKATLIHVALLKSTILLKDNEYNAIRKIFEKNPCENIWHFQNALNHTTWNWWRISGLNPENRRTQSSLNHLLEKFTQGQSTPMSPIWRRSGRKQPASFTFVQRDPHLDGFV